MIGPSDHNWSQALTVAQRVVELSIRSSNRTAVITVSTALSRTYGRSMPAAVVCAFALEISNSPATRRTHTRTVIKYAKVVLL
jgi:hypothetical protein